MAVMGVGSSPSEVQDLAADLGASIAATGRTTLLIDTHFGEAFDPAEKTGPTLAEMLQAPVGKIPDRSEIKRLLWDRAETTVNLLVVPPGASSADLVDALAGVAFGMVVEEARELVDVVIVSAPDVGTPAADAVASRSRVGVLVAHKDHTQRRDLTMAATHLSQIGARVAATVLLSGRLMPLAPGRSRRRKPRTRRTHLSGRGRAPDVSTDDD